MVQSLEARCDIKRINTCPSEVFFIQLIFLHLIKLAFFQASRINFNSLSFFRSFRSHIISLQCNSTLSLSPLLLSLPPLWRCRPPSPALLVQIALALRARVSMCRLEYASLWEAARWSRSGILVSPVKSSSTFLAVATMLAPMVRAWHVVGALDVRPHLLGKLSGWPLLIGWNWWFLLVTGLIGRASQFFKSVVVVASDCFLVHQWCVSNCKRIF